METTHKNLRYLPFPVGKGNDTASIADTQKLLDKAIALAWHTVKTDRTEDSRPPAFTPAQWVWQLAGAYHLTHSYPPLIEKAAQGFERMGRKDLSQWATQKATEERGHDRLALLDIQSMGYKAEAVVEVLLPHTTKALVNYLTQRVQETDPIGCVGYSYTIERIATSIKEKHIQSLEYQLPVGIRATRCLRVHSGIGNDVEHVKEIVAMVTELAPQERIRVATACYETALLEFNLSKEDYILEEKLQYILRPLELCTHLQARDEIHSDYNHRTSEKSISTAF
ncbi:hypothetical protein [Nodularia sp. NIES-3585]|uniref:hypothetical protein n=1 Tax=Nodularia sp. NIES-3585 TaxID=1973477 RepID=UPI000B64040C|nr:hypothetical protein [Nodularia sp. NIES-3585]GAX38293.1 hypothetical protein NIES3585_43420 [Nodularia sp. NIES-3585]